MNANDTFKITVVIPVHNRKEETLKCLRRLKNIDKTGMELTVVVIDDGSSDGTGDAVNKEFPDIVVLFGDGNLWWSGASNKGVEYALAHGADYIMTLNDDVEFNDDFLVHLCETVASAENVIACGVICDIKAKNTIISAGRYAKGFLGYNYSGYMRGEDVAALPDKDYESDIESGYAMLIPAAIFRKNGMFDAVKFPHHMGDMDFVLRAKRSGAKVMINPRARLYTEIGGNYLHNQVVLKSLFENLKSLFDIKSTVNLRTRWFFCLRHNSLFAGWLSYMFFIARISSLLLFKLILPDRMLRRIILKRRKLSI